MQAELLKRFGIDTAHLLAETIGHTFTEADIVHAKPADNDPGSLDIHLQINIRPRVNAPELSICADLGAGISLINRRFLENNFPNSEITKVVVSKLIKGVGGTPMTLMHKARFSFYAPGVKSGDSPGLLKETGEAWIVNSLEAGCLLANDWLRQRKVVIDYGKNSLYSPESHFRILLTTRKAGLKAVVRKVTIQQAVRVRPGQSMQVPVHYTDLPKGRSFMFTAQHPTALNAIVDEAILHFMQLYNPTEITAKIPRRTRLGTIAECENSAYFTASWAGVLQALTYTAKAENTRQIATPTSLATGSEDVNFAATSILEPKSPVPAMGAEFELSPYVSQLAQGKPATAPLNVHLSPSDTPYADPICHAINPSICVA